MELDSYKVFNGTCLNLILAFVLLVRMFHTGRMEALGLKKHSLKVLLYAPAAGYLLVLAIHFLLDKAGLFQWIKHATNAPAEQSIVSVLRHSSDIPLITVICFSAAIAAPLVEELIFRGYLYPIMKKIHGRLVCPDHHLPPLRHHPRQPGSVHPPWQSSEPYWCCCTNTRAASGRPSSPIAFSTPPLSSTFCIPASFFRMEPEPSIRQTGEDALVARLLPLMPSNPSLETGPGDDCAIIRGSGNRQLLLKTDCVVEGMHFLPGTAPELIGRKALARAVSDIGAMGGTPLHALVTLFVHADRPISQVEGIYRGMGRLARQFGISIAGGKLRPACGRAYHQRGADRRSGGRQSRTAQHGAGGGSDCRNGNARRQLPPPATIFPSCRVSGKEASWPPPA